MRHRVFRWVARVALQWFYRDIEVAHRSRIPASGPLLLAANHNNALIDALLLMACIERPLRLTAKATLLEHPLTRLLVRLVGIVPLRRTRDARPEDGPLAPERNAEAFHAVLDAFAHDEAILVFPEGISHSAPSLVPLRSGAARWVELAHREGIAVPLIPVGLTFERKWRPRSRVFVDIGSPVQASSAEVTAWTAALETGLRSVTLNHPSAEVGDRVMQLAAALEQLRGEALPLFAADPPFGRIVERARMLDDVRRRLGEFSPAVRDACGAFLSRLDELEQELQLARIPMSDLRISTSLASGVRFLVRETLGAVMLGPVAVWGKLSHWVPLSLARFVGLRGNVEADERAMRVVVAGFSFTLAWYALVSAGIWVWFGAWWALAWLVTALPSGEAYLVTSDRLRRAVLRVRSYVSLRGRPDDRHRWITQLDELVAEMARLEKEISAVV